jgi:hypothetical protein
VLAATVRSDSGPALCRRCAREDHRRRKTYPRAEVNRYPRLGVRLPYTVGFDTVSTVGLESSPAAATLAGLRAHEARYFMNK